MLRFTYRAYCASPVESLSRCIAEQYETGGVVPLVEHHLWTTAHDRLGDSQ